MLDARAEASTRKRGRPTKPARTDPVSLYASFLQAHPPETEPNGYSLELFVKRFAEAIADYTDARDLDEKFAEAAGISKYVASRVLAGLTPLTAKMVTATAIHLGISSDLLLVGRASSSSPAMIGQSELSEDEAFVRDAFEAADHNRRACFLFTLSLQHLLDVMPQAGRDRVIASLATLHDGGAQGELSFLPQVLGVYQARTGNDAAESFAAERIFTPWHELLGVFGPEQRPLWTYLQN